jgi:hypothetical protein
MPQSNSADLRRIVAEELSKALALPAGATVTPMSTGYLQALQQRGMVQPSQSAALARDPSSNASFGPGLPLIPAPLDPPLPSGRPAPRRWEYPVSWNLQTSTTRTVPWTILRDSADQVSIMRSCIETCKSAIIGLDWSFGIDSARAKHLAKRDGTSDLAVTADLQDKYADQLDQLHQWWMKPDRINNWTFSEWLGALLEDHLVLDVVAAYPHLTMGGQLHSLELLDGSTIKPLLDHRGATPQPPWASYQQILHGFPRGEYAQSPPEHVDAEFISAVYGPLDGPAANTDALIYKVRNRRTRGPYGFSCVEQALTDVDLWLKRYDWLRQEYDSGVTPQMLLQTDGNWTPEQLHSWEAVFNDELSGNSAERHRAKLLPNGFTPSYPNSVDSKFTSDFDLHLIRLLCAPFAVLPTSMGFTPNHGSSGLGGGGIHEGEQESQHQRGTKPTAQWITDLVNEVCTHYLGMPPEVTFRFHGLDEDNEEREANLLTGYVNGALKTLNEGRDQLNLPRYEFPEADQPFLSTPTGPAWLNVDIQPTGMPGNLPSAAQNQPGAVAPQPRDEPALKPDTEPESADKMAVKAVGGEAQERKAFLTFAAKRAGTGKWRDFEFTRVPVEIARAANDLAKGGDLDAVQALFDLTR